MIKIGIIGGEGHYHSVLRAAAEHPGNFEIVGVAPGGADEDISSLVQQLQNKGLNFARFEEYDALLDKAKPDVVVVCPQFYRNAEISISALRRDMHVFCEKPLATTLQDYEKLEQAAQLSQGKIVAMLEYRYAPSFYAAFQAVRRGDIGHVRMIHAQKSYKLGNRASFYRSRNTYGGTVLWVGIHAIDWIFWLTGQRFESVCAGHSARENMGHGDLESTVTAQFRMTDECVATLNCDYYRPAAADTHGDDRVRIVGTQGILEVCGQTVTRINHLGTVILPPEEPQNIFEDFIRYTQGAENPRLTREDSLYATKAALLALQSADSGDQMHF